MAYYRFIVQGQGAGANGQWLGCYAARQVRAATEEAAASEVLRMIKDDWAAGSAAHSGSMDRFEVVCVWRPFLAEWRKLPNAGHTQFGDDLDAQRGALRLEARAAAAPSGPVRATLRELSD